MQFVSESAADGVLERLFTVGDIPGVLWTPAGATGDRPLVLLSHGSGQHKKVQLVADRARRFVTVCGFAAAAIDAPGHGHRTRTDREDQFTAGLKERIAARRPVGAHIARYNAAVAALAVEDWRFVLDALLEVDGVGADGRVGFWGVSMGTAVGVLLTVAEPRITAAVFGLACHEMLAEPAARVQVPIQFLLQWDDERVPRESALTLFDAFASWEKTLHANPGLHLGVPAFEWESSEPFFSRHLVMTAPLTPVS